jgi:type IV secretory pathway VirB2 component (pilin)
VTFSPQRDRGIEALAGAALLLAGVATVVVFWPPEGWVLAPIHHAVDALLGRAAFLVPLALGLAGCLGLVRLVRPDVVLPRRRLAGLGVIAFALVPSERLLGGSTGVVGEWLTTFLLSLVGGPLTVTVIVILVSVGVALAFNVRMKRPSFAAR